MSHAGFLRDQHPGPEHDVITLIRGLAETGEEAAARPLAQAVAHVQQAIPGLLERAPSFAEDRPLLTVVAQLTLAPRGMRASALAPLREAGLSDREIHDVVNVVCCFSYMNRLADGLGVTADYAPDRPPDHPEGPGSWAERLLGAARLAAHRGWAAGED